MRKGYEKGSGGGRISAPSISTRDTQGREEIGPATSGDERHRSCNTAVRARAHPLGGRSTKALSGEQIVLAKPMTINERMMYSTVRIAGQLATGEEISGTSFFLAHRFEDNSKVRMLVSNRHVVGGVNKGTLYVHRPRRVTASGQVVSAGSVPLEIDDFESKWVPHPNPDVDLCALPYDVVHAAIQKVAEDVYATFFETTQVIPSDEALAKMDSGEEVQLIGYPDGVWDRVNSFPVFRRGTIATHPRVDFRGRAEILIDAAASYGSSGAPVVVLSRTSFKEEEAETWPVVLLGVLSSGYGRGAEGAVREDLVARTGKRGPIPTPMHLDVIVKARELVVLADAVAAKVGAQK
ncbi:S1 family peptidase [Frigoriglobus tundricola]|uniref:Serine protease n=1 Tax=Frigoriglobus tundricola TaxID=2774151 RepID=A0A6M5YXV6_9BACT|nr:serine protease [Frigoriglobus tundricola]QJW98728.1 hypothetical protein FTUN_6323 [Frigoriglobus tundricola]